jgi:hypothetical protein
MIYEFKNMATAEEDAAAIPEPKHIWWDVNRVLVYTGEDFPESEHPKVATAYQIRRALNQTDLRDSVEAFVKTCPKDVQDAWRYAYYVERYNPVLMASAAQMGLTDTQLNDLFKLAFSFID